MGILDYLRTQFLEIIQWEDDSRDTLSWRVPDEDKEIKRGAQLIVRESQVAQFLYLGQFGDTFTPGKHDLVTDNIPVLSTLRGWKYGLESPFKADVYFVNTRVFAGNKWGTSHPVMLRDKDFGVVRVRAFGSYDFRVSDVKTFLREVAGTDHHFRLEEFADAMRSRMISAFSEALATAQIPVLEVAARYSELGAALLPVLNPLFHSRFGLELTGFIVENVSVPPEVEQAIDQRSRMAAIGNLNDYVKLQMADSLTRPDGQSTGSNAAELAMGFGLAQQFLQQSAPPPAPAQAKVATELLTPAEAAQILKVDESDVLAALNDNSLRGKKIGSAWRIPRTALEEFLHS